MLRRILDFIHKSIERYDFRTVIAASFSLVLSVGFATLNAVISAVTQSFWYGALAVYYVLLAIVRFGVIFHHLLTSRLSNETAEHKKRRETRVYRICGVVLILLAFALGAAVLQMVLADRTFVNTPGLTIYLVAVYTFYKVIFSIFHVLRAHKDEDMTIQAVRNVNFADALVSMLALQTAMLHEFATDISIWQMNALTGTLVCLATVTIGIVMVNVGRRRSKKLKSEASE